MGTYSVIYQRHAVERMAQRGISEEDVENVLTHGEIIKDYPDDTPYPSKLLSAQCKNSVVHVVVATDDENKRKIVVTVYIPDSKIWEIDFKRRRKL